MTEAEAKTKWCPMVRNDNVSTLLHDRQPSDNQYKYKNTCIGSACMMWRQKAGSRKGGLDQLNLNTRTKNCLKAEGIETVRKLCSMTENDLLKIPDFGFGTLKDLRAVLKSAGLSLGMDAPSDDDGYCGLAGGA